MSRRYTYDEMQPAELRRALQELGLKPSDFARLSGTREDRFEQMLRGTRKIPQAIRLIALLLRPPGALAMANAVTATVVHDDESEPKPELAKSAARAPSSGGASPHDNPAVSHP